MLLCGRSVSLVVDKAESQEMRKDGISTTDPRQMYYDIISNPNTMAKYIEKSKLLIYKHRQLKKNEPRG